jgi:hypothetical protein
VVSAAGAVDMAQGAEILAASQDLEVQSILVSGLSEEDLRLGMEMGAIAGQLAVAADVVAMLDMPVLAEFLANKGDDLRDLAVDAIIKFGATRAMSQTMEAMGAKIGAMGADEMVEGLARRTVAEAAAQRSEELAMAGLGYAVSGIENLEIAQAAGEVAREMAIEGVADVAAGSMEMGAGATMEAVGEALAEKAM